MIQFNRYRLPDETYDFHLAFNNFSNTLAQEIHGDCDRSIGLLLSLAERFPLSDRLVACAARMFFWGKVSWSSIQKMMPAKLPDQWLYKQEIVGCLGFERSARKWGITEDQWRLYQGFADDFPLDIRADEYVSYRPRSSGFFSVIENVIAAHIIADMEGKRLQIDLTGNWWAYDEPFEDIFGDTFEFTKDGSLPQISFEGMRHKWTHANDKLASMLAYLKQHYYTMIVDDIAQIAQPVANVDSSGVMFVRGGDKLQTETIPQPVGFVLRELKNMERRCEHRYLLSDDAKVAELISSYDAFVIDKSDKIEGGYRHVPGMKVSCKNILANFMTMVEAKVNMSCPSANIVNAAQWSRIDKDNYSLANPVYRYLLI